MIPKYLERNLRGVKALDLLLTSANTVALVEMASRVTGTETISSALALSSDSVNFQTEKKLLSLE